MAQWNPTTDSGLDALNKHLEGASYIDGWNPTRNDVVVFDKTASLAHAPDAKKYPHVARWAKHIGSWSTQERAAWPAGAAAAPAAATGATPGAAKKDDDFDLFGEEEDAEHEKILEQRRKEHEEKKKASGKVVIAKSSVILEVKPWDDTTDMDKMHAAVRTIEMEGLVWGAGKFVPIGYGIRKLQIVATIVDDLVSVDDLQERIQAFEDLVQSVDIAAFNKL